MFFFGECKLMAIFFFSSSPSFSYSSLNFAVPFHLRITRFHFADTHFKELKKTKTKQPPAASIFDFPWCHHCEFEHKWVSNIFVLLENVSSRFNFNLGLQIAMLFFRNGGTVIIDLLFERGLINTSDRDLNIEHRFWSRSTRKYS